MAVVDPRTTPVNKVGIGILSPETEIEEAAAMVNNHGDWGWVLIVIKKSERNLDRWQSIFHELAANHLIPIVRIATDVEEKGNWQRPTDQDANSWADFLFKLYWPTKNRYVQIYNEVNRAEEWGGKVDAADYARELNKTIDALRTKSNDFFILNAPLDVALANGNGALDAAIFYETMETTAPGIFKKLNGWASHSYPNPDFSASPYKTGRTSLASWRWELAKIDPYLDGGDLPVFITETGWKRSSDKSSLSEEKIAEYYKIAFEEIWDDQRIVAVTPFIFSYPRDEFNQFAFVRKDRDEGETFYKYYYEIRDLQKKKGAPVRENLSRNFEFNLGKIIIKDRTEEVLLTFQNVGNFVWNNDDLKIEISPANLQLVEAAWEKEKIFPGQTARATLKIKSDTLGPLTIKLKIYVTEEEIASQIARVDSETYLSLILKVIGEKLKIRLDG